MNFPALSKKNILLDHDVFVANFEAKQPHRQDHDERKYRLCVQKRIPRPGQGCDSGLERHDCGCLCYPFVTPTSPGYTFERFYLSLKQLGFVIYLGKVTSVDTFRIGNIGEVNCNDIRRLLSAVEESIDWEQKAVSVANN